ncbi:MAG: LysR family transcriptional regulator [Cycloclasticus sp.]|nr:LysR family transcriptional regulator [Cycloclasticus sp.]MBQ0789101.1 LysR family transcriptional regulator [Cycloclasticus sp.]
MGLLEDMSIFVRIVDAGGIGKAALQMGLAKSAVSRRLAELERRLGATLINRTTRTYSLTDAGLRYYDKAAKVIDDVNELNGAMTESATTLTGTLNIAVPLVFGLSHLMPALDVFIKTHELLKLNIDFSDRAVDVINEGVDLAFRIAESMEPSNLVARKITAINRTLCASPAYLERYGTPQTPEDLKKHYLLGYSIKGSSIGQLRDKKGKLHRISGQNKLNANNGIFLKDMAVAGHGISGEPHFITWKAIKAGDLVPILTDYQLLGSQAYVVYPKTRYITQSTRRLIDFLVDYFGETPYWDNIS